MVLADFRIAFPELSSASDALVNVCLARALRSIDSSVWEDEADDGQGFLAAHYVATSPGGVTARLQSDKGKSTYLAAFEALRDKRTCAMRVF